MYDIYITQPSIIYHISFILFCVVSWVAKSYGPFDKYRQLHSNYILAKKPTILNISTLCASKMSTLLIGCGNFKKTNRAKHNLKVDFGFSHSTDFSGTIYHENDEACNDIGQLVQKVVRVYWSHLFLLSVAWLWLENANWKFAWLVFGVAETETLLTSHMYNKSCACLCPLDIVL